MTLLNILQFPDSRLKAVAKPVEKIDPEVLSNVSNMFETMYQSGGVGLAATQVNILQRIITIDTSANKSTPLCLINPEITHKEGELTWEEGCLSFPGISAKIERAAEITIQFLDQDGNSQIQDATGLLAICIQHELDHLNGITLYDHLSPLKQKMLKKKLKKIRDKSL